MAADPLFSTPPDALAAELAPQVAEQLRDRIPEGEQPPPGTAAAMGLPFGLTIEQILAIAFKLLQERFGGGPSTPIGRAPAAGEAATDA